MESYQHLADHVSVRVPTPGTRRSRRPETVDGKAIERTRSIETVREVDSAEPVLDVVPRERSDRLNRAVNLVLGGIALAVLSPFFVLVAIAIKLESSGPVLYRQPRLGQNGCVFILNKFRSMRQDAEKETGPVWATQQDSRITRVGGFLRRTRLDELPQLFNVLFGHMSFIGPRPERPEFVSELQKQIPYYIERLAVKPGITGWAQVRYRYGSSVEDAVEKLQYDLYYIKNLSLFLDLLIVLNTVQVVLFARGR